MKFISTLFISSVILFSFSCTNESNSPGAARKQAIDTIKGLEAEMHKSIELDTKLANRALKAYSDFAARFASDTLSPDFLFKAGEIATAIKQYSQALLFYKNITDKYPKFKLIPESWYLQGFLLDNFLGDDAKAKLIYEKVIADFPNSPYAGDAKAAINNLGKSDEELIKEFEKKNSGK